MLLSIPISHLLPVEVKLNDAVGAEQGAQASLADLGWSFGNWAGHRSSVVRSPPESEVEEEASHWSVCG